jgi:regulator of protease activity HflC (stomatin/prohibitin superfamily)
MNEQEIVQHLLELESEAASLIDGAQAEADRRVSEGEKRNRDRYDELYAGEVKALEASFTGAVSLAKDNYRKQLEEYGGSLKNVNLNTEDFFSLAEKLLVEREIRHG